MSQPIGLPSSSSLGVGGQLFLNPSTSSADEASLLDLWNVDPSTPTSQTLLARSELFRSTDMISKDTAALVAPLDNTNTSTGFYSSQTQRDLLFSLDHDSLTRSDFAEAAIHAIDFALADPNSQVTASDKSELQYEGQHLDTSLPSLFK